MGGQGGRSPRARAELENPGSLWSMTERQGREISGMPAALSPCRVEAMYIPCPGPAPLEHGRRRAGSLCNLHRGAGGGGVCGQLLVWGKGQGRGVGPGSEGVWVGGGWIGRVWVGKRTRLDSWVAPAGRCGAWVQPLLSKEHIVIVPTLESGTRRVWLAGCLAVVVGLKGREVEGGAAWRKPTAMISNARTRSPRPRSVLGPASGVSARAQLRDLPCPIVAPSSQLRGC